MSDIDAALLLQDTGIQKTHCTGRRLATANALELIDCRIVDEVSFTHVQIFVTRCFAFLSYRYAV